MELEEGVDAEAAGSDAVARGARPVPAAEEALYVAVQAEALASLSGLLAAGFASVAGFVVVVVATINNSICET